MGNTERHLCTPQQTMASDTEHLKKIKGGDEMDSVGEAMSHQLTMALNKEVQNVTVGSSEINEDKAGVPETRVPDVMNSDMNLFGESGIEAICENGKNMFMTKDNQVEADIVSAVRGKIEEPLACYKTLEVKCLPDTDIRQEFSKCEKTLVSCDEEERLLKLCDSLKGPFSDIVQTLSSIMKMIREKKQLCSCLIKADFLSKFDSFVLQFDLKFDNVPDDLNVKHECVKHKWPALKKFFMIVWIACDLDVNFCQYTLASNAFHYFVQCLKSFTSLQYEENEVTLFTVKSSLGILHNISRHLPNSKWRVRNEGLIMTLQPYLRSNIAMVRIKTLIVLSYILSEAENELISSNDENFTFIFEVLADSLKTSNHVSKKYGMNSYEVLRGISNLAINDENKLRIVRGGVLPLYEQVLLGQVVEEVKVSIATIWSLAFHHYNKMKIRESKIIMNSKLFIKALCNSIYSFYSLDNL